MITITKSAADKVAEIAAAEGIKNQILRVKIVGGGCNGYQYDLYFEDNTSDFDETFESNGITLVADQVSYSYLDGCNIDYVDNGLTGSGFKFVNPNFSSSCGKSISF